MEHPNAMVRVLASLRLYKRHVVSMPAKMPVATLSRFAQRRVPGIQSVMHQPMLGVIKFSANVSSVNTTVSSALKIASVVRISASTAPAAEVIVGLAAIRVTPRTRESVAAHKAIHARPMPTVGMAIA